MIRAFADTAGTTLLYSNSVPGLGMPWLTNYQEFTALASLGTNIMRLEFSAGGVAVVDDITINRAPVGDLQRIRDFQWAQTNLLPGMTAQASVIADYTLDTNDVAPWCSYVSDNPNVAKFSSSGQLTAVGPGTATIIATFMGNSLTHDHDGSPRCRCRPSWSPSPILILTVHTKPALCRATTNRFPA